MLLVWQGLHQMMWLLSHCHNYRHYSPWLARTREPVKGKQVEGWWIQVRSSINKIPNWYDAFILPSLPPCFWPWCCSKLLSVPLINNPFTFSQIIPGLYIFFKSPFQHLSLSLPTRDTDSEKMDKNFSTFPPAPQTPYTFPHQSLFPILKNWLFSKLTPPTCTFDHILSRTRVSLQFHLRFFCIKLSFSTASLSYCYMKKMKRPITLKLSFLFENS